jgi:hypothetical protein
MAITMPGSTSRGMTPGSGGLKTAKQVREIPGTVVTPAVDEERWRTPNAAANAAQEVVAHLGQMSVLR